MKLFVMTSVLCLLPLAAHGQADDCKRQELSQRKLKVWMQQAKSRDEAAKVLCYLQEESLRFHLLAEKEEAALKYQIEHHVMGPKYPTSADHARTFRSFYEGKSQKYSAMAHEVESRAAQVPAS